MANSHMIFLFSCSGDHLDLHSFPTRRSSDLNFLHTCFGPIQKYIWIDTHKKHQGQQWNQETNLTGVKVDRKSTRLNSSHRCISYAVFCLKKKNTRQRPC